MSSDPPKKNNVFHDVSSSFWETYVKGRPQVPNSLFDRFFTYHASHGGAFDTVHDAGAGPGNHTPRLAPKFKNVIVSDISPTNIAVAEKQLLRENPEWKEKLTFRPGKKLEDTDGLQPESVDLIFCANMLHFVDFAASTASINYQLKPGGSLCIGSWGVGTFKDLEVNSVWRELWLLATDIKLGGGPKEDMRGLGIETFRRLECGYDCFGLDKSVFEAGVQRIRLNSQDIDADKKIWKIIPDSYDGLGMLESQVTEDEVVKREEDTDWEFEWGMEDLEAAWTSYAWPAEVQNSAKFKELWTKLEGLVGGGRKVKGVWPAMLIMATKKRRE